MRRAPVWRCVCVLVFAVAAMAGQIALSMHRVAATSAPTPSLVLHRVGMRGMGNLGGPPARKIEEVYRRAYTMLAGRWPPTSSELAGTARKYGKKTRPPTAAPTKTCSGEFLLLGDNPDDPDVPNIPIPDGCTTVNGNVTIGLCSNADDPVAGCDIGAFMGSVTTINGHMLVLSNTFDSFEGLGNVEHISGFLIVSLNDNVQSLAGLGGLKDVAELLVQSNPNLRSLEGLTSLVNCPVVEIRGNGVTSLSGLENINTGPDSVLWIVREHRLETLNGLPHYRKAAHVGIIDNDALIDTSAISGIEELIPDPSRGPDYGMIEVSMNDKLSAIAPFEKLKAARGVIVTHNLALESIVGVFPALEQVGSAEYLGHVALYDNAKLSHAAGFEVLHTVAGWLLLDAHTLQYLDGFGALTSVSQEIQVWCGEPPAPGGANVCTLKTVSAGAPTLKAHVGLFDFKRGFGRKSKYSNAAKETWQKLNAWLTNVCPDGSEIVEWEGCKAPRDSR